MNGWIVLCLGVSLMNLAITVLVIWCIGYMNQVLTSHNKYLNVLFDVVIKTGEWTQSATRAILKLQDK